MAAVFDNEKQHQLITKNSVTLTNSEKGDHQKQRQLIT
jgi:hypothetical protein